MRAFIKLSLAGAIALAAVACNKDVEQSNPYYNPETKEVTRQRCRPPMCKKLPTSSESMKLTSSPTRRI